jgi:protein-tyrosine-phosphatase
VSGTVINLVFLCTGNAARSVMAGAVLNELRRDVAIVTAGTHVIEGQPMSRRTRDALDELGLSAPGHRSHQLGSDDVAKADLVVAMAREHVVYVRRNHPEVASRTATIRRLCRDLSSPPPPLSSRLAMLDLADVSLEPWEDVPDPAGGDIDVFRACAREMQVLVDALAPRLGAVTPHSSAGSG